MAAEGWRAWAAFGTPAALTQTAYCRSRSTSDLLSAVREGILTHRRHAGWLVPGSIAQTPAWGQRPYPRVRCVRLPDAPIAAMGWTMRSPRGNRQPGTAKSALLRMQPCNLCTRSAAHVNTILMQSLETAPSCSSPSARTRSRSPPWHAALPRGCTPSARRAGGPRAPCCVGCDSNDVRCWLYRSRVMA